jgi:hypothetical protein
MSENQLYQTNNSSFGCTVYAENWKKNHDKKHPSQLAISSWQGSQN